MSRDVPAHPLLTAMLALLTTTGDLLYRSASGLTRLAIGSTHHVLTVAGGVPTWAAGSKATLDATGAMLYASAANTLAKLAAGATGARLVINGSGVPAWIPIGTVAMGAYDVDFAAGARFTKTITTGQTITFSNETYGHQEVVIRFTNSGVTAMPTWPSGMVRIGSGAWVTTDAVVNTVVIIRYATGDYQYTVSQNA